MQSVSRRSSCRDHRGAAECREEGHKHSRLRQEATDVNYATESYPRLPHVPVRPLPGRQRCRPVEAAGRCQGPHSARLPLV